MEKISSFVHRSNSIEQKPSFEYQVLGKEMYEHFGQASGRRIFPLFSSPLYNHRLIRDTWDYYKKNHSTKPLNYFLKVLHERSKLNV